MLSAGTIKRAVSLGRALVMTRVPMTGLSQSSALKWVGACCWAETLLAERDQHHFSLYNLIILNIIFTTIINNY